MMSRTRIGRGPTTVNRNTGLITLQTLLSSAYCSAARLAAGMTHTEAGVSLDGTQDVAEVAVALDEPRQAAVGQQQPPELVRQVGEPAANIARRA